MTNLGQAQQSDPLFAASALGKIVGGINAPTTVSNTTQLSPLNQIGSIASALGGSISGTDKLLKELFPAEGKPGDPNYKPAQGLNVLLKGLGIGTGGGSTGGGSTGGGGGTGGGFGDDGFDLGGIGIGDGTTGGGGNTGGGFGDDGFDLGGSGVYDGNTGGGGYGDDGFDLGGSGVYDDPFYYDI
jgi:hypothetical protein